MDLELLDLEPRLLDYTSLMAGDVGSWLKNSHLYVATVNRVESDSPTFSCDVTVKFSDEHDGPQTFDRVTGVNHRGFEHGIFLNIDVSTEDRRSLLALQALENLLRAKLRHDPLAPEQRDAIHLGIAPLSPEKIEQVRRAIAASLAPPDLMSDRLDAYERAAIRKPE